MAWVYILKCADDTYYVGSTTDLDRRMAQHDRGEATGYTRRRRPLSLLWTGEFASVAEAFRFEKRVQGWRRAKREALIRGDFLDLPALASRRRSEAPTDSPSGS